MIIVQALIATIAICFFGCAAFAIVQSFLPGDGESRDGER